MTLRLSRVHHAEGPDDPAVGVHWSHGTDIGLIPAPPHAGSGMCWSCRTERIGRTPPLCTECAWAVWGDRVETTAPKRGTA